MRIDMFGHGMARELRDEVTRSLRNEPSLANWLDLTPLFDHLERTRTRILDANDIDIQVLTTRRHRWKPFSMPKICVG